MDLPSEVHSQTKDLSRNCQLGDGALPRSINSSGGCVLPRNDRDMVFERLLTYRSVILESKPVDVKKRISRSSDIGDTGTTSGQNVRLVAHFSDEERKESVALSDASSLQINAQARLDIDSHPLSS